MVWGMWTMSTCSYLVCVVWFVAVGRGDGWVGEHQPFNRSTTSLMVALRAEVPVEVGGCFSKGEVMQRFGGESSVC